VCEELSLQVGDIIEFSGSDEVAKTHVLMNIVGQCILPKLLSGSEVDVVFISTDTKFNILTLVGVIKQKLRLLASRSDRIFIDSILDRFHLFEITSISNCCMVLRSLFHLPHGRIGALIVDDIGTLSWENKACTKKDPRLEDCVEMVKRFAQEREVVTVLSHFFPLIINDARPWLKPINYRYKLEQGHEGKNVKIQQLFPDNGKVYSCGVQL
jgi:hypothetical protein